MFHQPAVRLVPSTILESTGFVRVFFYYYSVPFVCVHVFFCCKYPKRDPVLGLYQALVLSSSALPWGFGCCWREVKQWLSCVEALLDGLLSSADFQGISEIYQCKGKNQFCSNFIACTSGTGVSSVGVIVCNVIYFTNKVRKTRACVLVSQNFQIFFHINLSSGFLLQISELPDLFQY